MTGLRSRVLTVWLDFNFTLANIARAMQHEQAIADRLGRSVEETRTAMKRYELPFEAGHLDELTRMSGVLRNLGIEPGHELVNELIELERQTCLEAMELYPGTIRLLNWLKNRDVDRILVCNGNPITRYIAEDLGVSALCSQTIFSCDRKVKAKKPDRHIYVQAMRATRVPPPNCLYVGDGGDRELWGIHQIYPQIPRVRVDHKIDGQRRDPSDPDLASEHVIPCIAYLIDLLEPVVGPR